MNFLLPLQKCSPPGKNDNIRTIDFLIERMRERERERKEFK